MRSILIVAILLIGFLHVDIANSQLEPRAITQTKGGYYLPVNQRHTESGYIGYGDSNTLLTRPACHLANDYQVDVGTNVYAIADGYVERTSSSSGGYGGFNPTLPGGVMFVRHNMAEDGVMYGLYGHIDNMTVSAGDSVVAGQLLGTVGDFINGATNQSLPHLHFGLTSILPASATSYAGYTPTSTCRNFLGYVDPEPVMDRANNIATGYEWHGSGSLVSHDGTGNCFGCSRDTVQLHSTRGKPLATFQWKEQAGQCRGIEITATGSTYGSATDQNIPLDNLRVSIRNGSWQSRDLDQYYVGELPLRVSHPATDWNFIAIMLPVPLSDLSAKYTTVDFSKGIQIHASCIEDFAVARSDDRMRLVENTSAGIRIDGEAEILSGSGSIMNFRKDTREKRYGISKDVALLRSPQRTDKAMAVFQWQPGTKSDCLKLYFEELKPDQLLFSSTSPSQVKVKIRGWDQPPSAAITYNVTLPWTSTFPVSSTNYYVISVEYNSIFDPLPSSGFPSYIRATCK